MNATKLRLPLQQDESAGAQNLVLWLNGSDNGRYAFRETIAHVEAALGHSGRVTVELPQEALLEDFVAGEMSWAGRSYTLYFEHALGYLQFSSPAAKDIAALAQAISPLFAGAS